MPILLFQILHKHCTAWTCTYHPLFCCLFYIHLHTKRKSLKKKKILFVCLININNSQTRKLVCWAKITYRYVIDCVRIKGVVLVPPPVRLFFSFLFFSFRRARSSPATAFSSRPECCQLFDLLSCGSFSHRRTSTLPATGRFHISSFAPAADHPDSGSPFPVASPVLPKRMLSSNVSDFFPSGFHHGPSKLFPSALLPQTPFVHLWLFYEKKN